MRIIMKLIKFLLAIAIIGSMSMPLIRGESKRIHYAKKGIKIAWYGAQILIGIPLEIGGLQMVRKADLETLFAICIFSGVVAPTLLYSGIAGLDEELELRKHAQKLYKKYVDKKDEGNYEIR
jgi:hypothetical protein